MSKQSASTVLAARAKQRLESLYGNCDRRAQEWIRMRSQFKRLGIDAQVENEIRRKRAGYFFGLDRVRPNRNGTFDFDDAGRWHVILPELREGEIVDLVAFTMEDSYTLTTLRGTAALLGEEELEGDRLMDGELLLFDNPLTWMMQSCAGGVVVSLDPPPALFEGAQLVVESRDLANRLNAALTRPRPAPRIALMVGEEVAA